MFQIYGIPDFDQKRELLPNNGKMYCVPTSFINLIYYMGMHGIYELLFNGGDPDNTRLFSADPNVRYAAVTDRILDMGLECDTDPEDGTSSWDPFGATGYDGLVSYLSRRSNVTFNVVHYSSSDSFPGPATALGWLQSGCMVAFLHGKYDEDYVRDGGHCVTLTGVSSRWYEPPSDPEPEEETGPYNPHIEWSEEYVEPDPPTPGHWIHDFAFHDAVAGDSLNAQSPLKTKVRPLSKEWHTWGTFGGFAGDYYPLWRIGSGRRFVDSYYYVHPQKALTNVVTNGLTWFLLCCGSLFGKIEFKDFPRLKIPKNDLNCERPADQPFLGYSGPGALPILNIEGFRREFGGTNPKAPASTNPPSDVVWMPVIQHAVFTIGSCEDVFGYNPTTGKIKRIIKLPAPPRKVIFGGHQIDLFSLLPGTLTRVDLKDILNQRAEVKASAKVAGDAETLAFDEAHQRLIVASQTALHFYDRELKPLGSTPVPSLTGKGKLTVRVSRKTGAVYFLRSGQRDIQKVSVSPETAKIVTMESIKLADAPPVQTFDLGTLDQIVISDGRKMAEFSPNGKPVPNSVWNNFAAGTVLELTQNFHNPPNFKETWLNPDENNETEIPE